MTEDAHDLGPRAVLAELLRVLGDPGRLPLLVALDFDGTLAPLEDDPTLSHMSAGAHRSLQRLTRFLDGPLRLALVSGRTLDSLVTQADPPLGTLLVGSHGSERGLVTPEGLLRTPVVLTLPEQELLEHLTRSFTQIGLDHPGVWVEVKPSAVVLHTRLAEPDQAADAAQAALAICTEVGLTPLLGKDVVEMAVITASKGIALTELRAQTEARTVLFAGDDVTDEHALETLGAADVGIRVGAGATAARFRLSGTADVDEVLAGLARLLEEASGGTATPEV